MLMLACMAPVVAQEIERDEFEIERESEVLMQRGQGVVTQLDFDVFLSRLPEHHRAAFVSSPDRIANALNELVTPRQLATEAREQVPDLIDDPLFQGQLYQAATVQIAERYMTYLWEQERLDDYSDQAQELYLVRKDLLRPKPRADFTHVLVQVGGMRSELDAMRSILNLYELLEEGRTLAELAVEYSEDPGVEDNGGRYENAELDTLDPAVADTIRTLEPGQISQPFRSEFGWHILKLHDLSRPEVQSFEQVREQALQVAEERHKARVKERVLRRLNQQPVTFAEGAIDRLLSRYTASPEDLEKIEGDLRQRLGQD